MTTNIFNSLPYTNSPKYKTGDLLIDVKTKEIFHAGRIGFSITGAPYYECVEIDDGLTIISHFISEKDLALVSTQKTLKAATNREVESLIFS